MRVPLLLSFLVLLSACTTIHCNITGSTNATVNINTDRNVNTNPSLEASGNTVPVSALPGM